MATANSVRLGLWTNYATGYSNRWQILATDYWASVMMAVDAVCLTLAYPYIINIVSRWPLHVSRWLTPGSEHRTSPVDSQSNIAGPLTRADSTGYGTLSADTNGTEDSANRSGSSGFSSYLSESQSIRKILRQFIVDIMRTDSTPSIFLKTAVLAVLFGTFVAWTAAGILLTRNPSDQAALSSSTHCGIWQFDEDAGDEAAYLDDLHNHWKESRASQYARNCYSSLELPNSMDCSSFYNGSISFTTRRDERCPFKSPELCLDGLYSAVSFDTGLVDSNIIGINSPTTYRFRRRSICSPLNVSEPYIQTDSKNNSTTYRYYYGSKGSNNSTFETTGDTFSNLVPVYAVNTYFSSNYPEYDYWHPLPGLLPDDGGTLTIMFVSSMHIYYTNPSFDPIFPAKKPKYFPGQRKPLYYNSDPRALPFACVDKTTLCTPDGRSCWPMTTSPPAKAFNSPAYWFMKWSLEISTVYDSIKWRLGSALLAQESVSQFVSSLMEPNQWEVEASHLFATSLARVQWDAWSLANGEDRDRPGYEEVTPDEAKGQLCGIYKFKSAGYSNINLVAFVGLILLAIVIFGLSREVTIDKGVVADAQDGVDDLEDYGVNASLNPPLVFEVLLEVILVLIYHILLGIRKSVLFVLRRLRRVYRHVLAA
ncbi:hypothetical protein AJ80_03413 [Polytolypa hystricis UAMH7299]|uniref:Uncharacterized protein n=1 Tax=Polytolypa hystricis (strain UAMH7299) TaxID=1447883 RepID=A0A2B7YGW9_POLH7|nr:hypothetical protein AJ80_03413 [Polytolypa hystricis UAMH7299]